MKTVVEMAREAGLFATEFGAVHGDMYHLERFAAIVREDERENRQWRDLTTEEKVALSDALNLDRRIVVIDAVIAKFKEKQL